MKDDSETFRFQLYHMIIFYTLLFIQFQLTNAFRYLLVLRKVLKQFTIMDIDLNIQMYV